MDVAVKMTFRRPSTSYIKMQSSAPTRFIAITCLSACTLLQAQTKQTPRPKPSALAPASPAPLPTAPLTPPAPLTPAQSPAHRAEVTYTGDQLSISANNSSLNQILREISRLTAIKISGGVADERVFGQYGPSAPSQVLAALLDGTGSNLLLIQSSGSTPAELILTPRMGGPTPPNPSAPGFDESSESEDSPPNPVAQPIRPQIPAQYGPRPMPAATAPNQDNTNPGNQPAPTDPNQPQSPTGVKTPQQIYDELQRLRQQQQQRQQ